MAGQPQLSTVGSLLPLFFQDLDEMDADLLGLKTSPPAPNKGAAKGSGKEELPRTPQPAAPLTARERGEWDSALTVCECSRRERDEASFLRGLSPSLCAQWQLLEQPPE